MARAVPPLFLLAVALVGSFVGHSRGGSTTTGAADERDAGGKRVGVAAASAAPAARPRVFVPPGKSFRFPAEPQRDVAERDATPPFSLTATDGTGLALVAIRARGVLEPPLAFTELYLTFDNPRDRVIEGRFRVALPPGAALSRFAMKIGESWQEGEVVERQRARQAYEDFLHRRQDPALLEQEAANEFSARVFPIPARGRKEIAISWSHALTKSDEAYVLPLLGLPEVGELDARVLLGERAVDEVGAAAGDDPEAEVSETRVVSLRKRGWTPDRDLIVAQDRLGARAGLRHGNLAVVRVAAPVEAQPQEIGGLFVLVDSSASRALGWERQVDRVGELIAGLREGAGAATPLAVAAFDQEVAPIFAGAAGEFAPRDVERLRARRALGASDLQGALRYLHGRLEHDEGSYPRVLLITDGVATAGDVETSALRAAVRALRDRGVERLDALAFGGLRDDAVLHELTTGNLPHDGQRLDGNAPLAELGRRLTLACRSGIKVGVEGASWVWPETLDGVQPGDETLVFADVADTRALRVTLDRKSTTLAGEVASAERPLLQRAWAQARIDRLLHLRANASEGDDDLRRALTLKVTELSITHRVLSPFTALLVLETEFDYARYGLERRALADILTVGSGGIEVLARSAPSVAPPAVGQPKAPASREQVARRRSERRYRLEAPPAPATAPPPPAEGGDAVAEPMMRQGRAANEVEDEAALRSLGYLRDGDVAATAVEEGVDGGVEGVPGGVSGGVVGGVAGGVPGGVVSGAFATAPPPPPAVPPPPRSGAPATEADEVTITAESPLPNRVAEVPAEPAQPRAVREGAARDHRGAPATEQTAAAGERDDPDAQRTAAPYEGRFAEVMAQLAAGRVNPARQLAERWSAEAPGDVLALIALGEAWEAAGELPAAARAYGSLIDLFPSRADMRRLAGERLERLGRAGITLAVDTYEKAVEQRPDHPSSHRLYAWALLRAGRFADAFAALEAGLARQYPGGRFAGVQTVLQDDLGILGAAWMHEEPGRRNEIFDRLRLAGARLAEEPSLRFVLSWETDANDVDLHVYDRRGAHAYYSHPELPSGGRLYADVTTGYGPECFAVPRPRGGAAPYRLGVHYYSRGPMGYGMGTVQVVSHDGRGGIVVQPRPFVVMIDRAMVDLGTVGAEGGAGQQGNARTRSPRASSPFVIARSAATKQSRCFTLRRWRLPDRDRRGRCAASR